MAIQRAIFEVTCDSNGIGTDDVTLKLPSTLTRHARVCDVTIDSSDVTALLLPTSVTINELNDVTGIDVPVDDEDTEIGRQLFFTDDVVYDAKYSPRDTTVTEVGAAATEQDGDILIRTKKARCLVLGSPSGVYTVNMYYETAGDYRF